MRRLISRIFTADSAYSVADKTWLVFSLAFPATAAAMIGTFAALSGAFWANFGLLGVGAIAVATFFVVAASLALVADFFRWRQSLVPKASSPEQPAPKSDAAPKKDAPLEAIHGKHFRNERIIADGKSYTDCVFDNVTIVYNGGAAQMSHCDLGDTVFTSDIPEVNAYMGMLHTLGYLNLPAFFDDGRVLQPGSAVVSGSTRRQGKPGEPPRRP